MQHKVKRMPLQRCVPFLRVSYTLMGYNATCKAICVHDKLMKYTYGPWTEQSLDLHHGNDIESVPIFLGRRTGILDAICTYDIHFPLDCPRRRRFAGDKTGEEIR